MEGCRGDERSDHGPVLSLCRLKKKSQSVDMTAPGFGPLAGAGKAAPQTGKATAPKTPTIEEEQHNVANARQQPPRRSGLQRFYTIGECAGHAWPRGHRAGCERGAW